MASDNEAYCVSDPNFAVICSFLECFGKSCGIDYPDIATLQKMLEDTHEVAKQLIDLHVKLLRKTRKSVSSEKWERALVKFCHTYSNQDGWELERFGYKKARLAVKLRLLKVLLESQFDLNQKFKNEVNKLAAKELRLEPLGRDKTGLAYWYQLDEVCNIRVYREDIDEESWELVANDREGVVNLINTLSDGEAVSIPINEDSNSLEISEKPIIDTGQVSTSSPSLDEDAVQENGDANDLKNGTDVDKHANNEDVQKPSLGRSGKKPNNDDDDAEEATEDEEEEEDDDDEDAEDEEDLSNDETSKQNTEDEESQDTSNDQDDETSTDSKPPVSQQKKPIQDNLHLKHKIIAYESGSFEKEIPTAKTSVIKLNAPESTPLKSIETPVITTSPLKLVNIAELKHMTNDRIPDTPTSAPVLSIKPIPPEDIITSAVKMHEKIQHKNPLPFIDPLMGHSKFPIKPIDQLAANLVRMQSEKLEKPSASKLLEKIAENLARSSSAHGHSAVINGDEEKFLSNLSARNLPEKLSIPGSVRSSRGMDLSTSPRGWESTNDHHNRPMDFSGIDLSSRKASKPAELPSPGYRAQDFQYREMDLSTRKVPKPELPNLPYDPRAAILRNHALVTDLSKRQMPFVGYDMPSAYHSAARIPGKEEHRLPSYTILPDPSKLASMRSGAAKRTLEAEDPQQEMLKRLRTDLVPMRGLSIEKKPLVGGLRRDDVGPAIEEPLMMVNGEGSGSDCDAGNPDFGEAIEEPVIFFYGEGSGHQCDTGNPGDETSTDNNKESNESKSEGCSQVTATLSQTKVTESDPETMTSKSTEDVKPVQLNSEETNTTSNCQSIDAETSESPSKGRFKPTLGVQLIAKTVIGPVKRLSRWDVGAPDENRECDSSMIISNEENISLESSVNDAGYQGEQDTKIPEESARVEFKLDSEAISSSTSQSAPENTICSSTTDAEKQEPDQSSISARLDSSMAIEENKDSTSSQPLCDSSAVEPMEVESLEEKKDPESIEKIKTSHCDKSDEPPRFFFGPNCVSYTPSTFGKENLEQKAASSSIHSIKKDPEENTITSENNNSVKSLDIPITASESREADLDNSEEDEEEEEEITEEKPQESLKNLVLSTTDFFPEKPSISVDDTEDNTESNADVSMDQATGIENINATSTTTIITEVPESSNVSTIYPEDERGTKESPELAATDSKKDQEDVSHSGHQEIEPEVIENPELDSLDPEELSSASLDDNTKDDPEDESEKNIDSSSVTVEPELESMDTNLDEQDSVRSKDVYDAQMIEGDDNAMDSNNDREEVPSLIEGKPSHVEIEKTIEGQSNLVESCNSSSMESTRQSVSNQNPTCEVSPTAIVDSSIPELTERITVANEREMDSQKNVDSTDAFGDDLFENQSISADQDSNEPMVIDDRISDSMDSTKDPDDKPVSSETELKPSEALQTESVIHQSTSVDNEDSARPFQEAHPVSADNSKSDEKQEIASEDIKAVKHTSESQEDNVSVLIPEESKLETSGISAELEKACEPVVSTTKQETSESTEAILPETSSKPSLLSQASLVANYDSNDSNDTGSDDVFEAESIEADSQDAEEFKIPESESSQVAATLEAEATTSTENIPTIDTKIDDKILPTEVEIDNNPIEEPETTPTTEAAKDSAVDQPPAEEIKEPCAIPESIAPEKGNPERAPEILNKDHQENSSKTEVNKLDIPEQIVKDEQTTKICTENITDKSIEEAQSINDGSDQNPRPEAPEDTSVYSNEYSESNSCQDSDTDDDDEEAPIIHVAKRPRTEVEEIDKQIVNKSECVPERPKENQLLHGTHEYEGGYIPSIVTPVTKKNDEHIAKLQIGEKPGIAILDKTTSDDTYVKENTNTMVKKSLNEEIQSIGIKESLEECKPSLTVSTVTVDSAQDDITESTYIKADVKKEASKRLHITMDSEDLPPFKSKPSTINFVKDEPQSFANDIKSFVDQKPIEICEKSSAPVPEITTLIPPVLQPDKKEAEIKNEETNEVCPNNLVKIKENIVEEVQDNIKSTVLSSVKLVEEDSEDSTGIDNECAFEPAENDVDPVSLPDQDVTKAIDLENAAPKLGVRVKPMTEMQYEGWKLDSTEPPATPKVSRKRRNSGHDSNSDDGTGRPDDDKDEMMGGKRIKLRGKRTPDMALRKSVEKSRIEGASSEDEAAVVEEPTVDTEDVKGEELPQDTVPLKARIKAKSRRRKGFRSKRRASRHKKSEPMSSAAETPNLVSDGTPIDDASGSTPNGRKKRKKRKMVLGLEIGIDIAAPDSQGALTQGETPVRQSRRIAQLKIKEEADRRRIEEETLGEIKEKKRDRDGSDKKKRKKQKNESDDDVIIKELEKEAKVKKKRKKRKKEAKFNEAKPWQSSSGSSTEEEDQNDEEEDEEDDIESEGSLLFKSDHEFSPESDLEKDHETEPMRRARTAQKSQSDVEEADDEYACQKCGKADHPEWILLCDTCDKGWHCSCLRPALMLIPEGDWFCPPCQHNLLVNKLRDGLKSYDQLAKRHENEILRKKRLAFVGISLDNVLQKNDRHHRGVNRDEDDEDEDSDDDNDDVNDRDADGDGEEGSSSSSDSSGSRSSDSDSSSEESEPVYQLRERRCANTYKFNEYDDMINAAIQDEVEAVQGAGNQGRGKDISTIVNAEKEEAEVEAFDKQVAEEDEDADKQSEKDSDKEYTVDKDEANEDAEEQQKSTARKMLARKKHRKLNSLDISSEDDPDSDEDFKGTSSDDEEDYDDQLASSDDSSFTARRRRSAKNSRPVRRSTRAARKTRYDEDFINDDSDESDKPKRKKSKSMWDESESESSDNSWRQRKKRSKPSSFSRFKASSKSKSSKKKKKRKRIIEPENQSDNEGENEEEQPTVEVKEEEEAEEAPAAPEVPIEEPAPIVEPPVAATETPATEESSEPIPNEVKKENQEEPPEEPKPELTSTFPEIPVQPPPVEVEPEQKKERAPKQKRTPAMRRKIIYGGLPDNRPQEEEEPLGRRTRGRKINYQVDIIMSDSEEELKKALRKTEESEDEFVVNEGDDFHDDGDKDSDSGDIYSPNKDTPKGKYKSPKNRRSKKSPASRKSMTDNGEPKQRKKPGPKPGSKNKPRQPKTMISPLEGGVMGDVPEGSLAGLGAEELAGLDDEQLEQMMMEDEEYGRRQLELAAIEIAKNKKKEEREAKKLEKARLKALEILAAEQQRDPNAPEGTDGEIPKKKKRGRRSKAEILAEQMRRDGAPQLGGLPPTMPSIVPLTVNPVLSTTTMPGLMMPGDPERPPPPPSAEGHNIPLITGPDGQLFNPDGTPVKPKRRGRGKGKKTLALEAARAAEAAAKAAAEAGALGLTGADANSELKPDDIPNVLPTPGSSTSGSAPSTPPAVSAQGLPSGQPAANPQSVYPQLPPSQQQQQSSVITRMLQSQPVSTAPQSFTAAAAAMGQKYFGLPNTGGPMMAGPRPSYEMPPRGRIPSPYSSRPPGQVMPPHFAAVRSGTPPMRMRVPGPTQLYHTSHHPMDPSPSGGGPISIASRDRASPLGPGPVMIPPAAGSPLAKGGPTPPPYVRGGPPLSRFSENPQLGPRHQMPPFTSASPANHSMQQPSPPPNRPPGNFSPYHPQPPPNYHYGAYPPPTPMSTADDAAAYQGSPYSAEHFSTPAENPPPIQGPTPQTSQPQAPPPHPNEPGHGPPKQYDEEGTGEFGGLVSYFSSQREDDLDS